MTAFQLPGLPFDVTLEGEGGGTAIAPVRIAAGPRTDLFVDPATGSVTLNAVRVIGSPGDGDFQLSVRVEVSFADTFDAGALLVWRDESTWAKLLLEYSPEHQPMVVSVVTRGRSDDANGPPVYGTEIWLRISRIGAAYAFHSSLDGARWDLVRHFTLGPVDGDQVGLLVQAPIGDGCDAVFHDVAYAATTLADLRDGH
jgi:uncharacterized protein